MKISEENRKLHEEREKASRSRQLAPAQKPIIQKPNFNKTSYQTKAGKSVP